MNIKCYAATILDKNIKVNRHFYQASLQIKPQLKVVFILCWMWYRMHTLAISVTAWQKGNASLHCLLWRA